jgi:dCTP deaminase
MILNDLQIKKLARKGMIEPFSANQVRINSSGEKVISYGLSSYGYDIRLSNEYFIFNNFYSVIVDPKNFINECFVRKIGDECIIPPNSFVLANSFESFKIPKNIIAICLGKSTYARCGIIINVTPLEPGWCGSLTIEISNSTSLPVKIYSWEGIGQLLFFRGESCSISYSARKGKYQNQKNITIARL